MTIEWWQALIAAAALIGIGVWVGKVETDRKNFREFMYEIRGDIKELLRRLPAKPLAETSPLSLTDKGREMLAEINGETWARKLSKELVEEIRGMGEYQVQEFCFYFVQERLELTDEQEAMVRKCAYENASDRSETMQVLAVQIRDNLLGSAN